MDTDALSMIAYSRKPVSTSGATDEISFKLMGFVPLVSGERFGLLPKGETFG